MKKMMIVMAMVVGLLIAGTVRAEEAWVLWEYARYGGEINHQGRLDDAWYVFAAYSSQDACERVQVVLNRNTNRRGDVSIIYRCLPASVDPRK